MKQERRTTSNKKNVADTFILLIPYQDIKITKPERFSPNLETLWNLGNAQSVNCSSYATAIEKQKNYYPKLSITAHRRVGEYSVMLRIEFSAMKLINQPSNNLEEVCDEDFETIVKTLQKRISELGARVSPESIRKAKVPRIDYGKNCKVQIKPALLLQELAKADISKRLDSANKTYRNDGHSLHFLTTHKNVVLYDKLADIRKANFSPRRAVGENAQLLDWTSLADEQYLRFEIQLGNSDTIRQALNKAGVNIPELTFENLFQSEICRKVNLYYWNELMQACLIHHLCNENVADLFKQLLNNGYKILKALQLIGLTSVLSEMGMREFRFHAGKTLSPAIYDLLRKIKNITPREDWLMKHYLEIQRIIEENNVIQIERL